MMKKFIISSPKVYILLLTFAIVLISISGHTATEILNIRHWTAPDHTRIVLDINDVPDYTIKKEKDVLILNLRDSSPHPAIPQPLLLNKPGIDKIDFKQIGENDCLISFYLNQYQKTEVFKLKKFQDKPDRIVVDIWLEEKLSESIPPPSTGEMKKKKRIIVIDPGHGGEDPGAIGKKGTYEKNIVLQISREIQNAINTMPGFRAVLTREGDYYVSFNKRLKKARDLNAGLFISIHADAARNRMAKGSSVYCLSTGAASSEAARLLANNENLSDILGGVPENESNNESNQILMNMFQTNTINLSKIYAEVLIKHLQNVNCVKYKIVQEAPFRVLKLPDIPAVLIETAYLSNLHEEKLLRKKDFQKQLARAVSDSIRDYFSGTATEDEGNKTPVTIYTVQKGDTLFRIAKRFQTHVKNVLDMNDIGLNDPLIIGQKITVPAFDKDLSDQNKEISDKEPTHQQKTAYYTVKKGETLSLIARRFNTPVNVLLRLNKLDVHDKLLVGHKIIVPANPEIKTEPQKELSGQKKRKKPAYYTVKKGETLLIIAKKYSTTIAELCKINHMKPTDKLLCGQKIKIP
jgi:N-acetylmuramoyl-L-alanine amidase